MSENQEIETNQGHDPMAVLPGQDGRKSEMVEPSTQNLNRVDESIDSQSYFLGEVPQANQVDPHAFLPLNSDRLIGSINVVEKLLYEVGVLIEDEVGAIQKHQKRITFWEDRIEKNRALVKQNEHKIKQNTTDALYDKKNRDYWLGRSEEVEIDYSHAEVAARTQDWAWLIKKYGLKNADGSPISEKSHCVEELCNGEIKNLSAEYLATGNKYENARKEKETESSRLVRENAKLHNSNDVLQGYISAVYTNDIEPLQDGILLLKEFGVKLKSLGQEDKATYGEMRAWAEPFLSDFIKMNSRVPQAIVTHFRKLSSIPLPPEFC
ncbi:MAG: hypothetical protein COT85_07580 [Chlamydiae bacterium CG10_big_fil_rev_8_21_14_0_10_42_34]|nr:MAG: hypothetical protein COT85_07580 [Chlamydiae bacterium CG10_big_fil_rev_8_21_14_0_10_42_34]